MTPTLESAITQAVGTHQEELDALNNQSADETIETTQVEQTEVQEDDNKGNKKETTQPELDEDTIQGRNLVQALRDPLSAALVIDYLAKSAGYTKGTIETKKDVKDAKTELTEILENELGDELKFIAPKLGAALSKYLENRQQTENPEIANLRTRIENTERDKIESEVSRAHTAISQEYFAADDMPPEVASALSKAMDEFPPSSNMTPSSYYKRIFNFVAGDLGLSKKTATEKTQSDRVAKNKQDSAARNLSATNRGVTPNPDGSAKKMNLSDAVSKAVAEVNASSKK